MISSSTGKMKSRKKSIQIFPFGLELAKSRGWIEISLVFKQFYSPHLSNLTILRICRLGQLDRMNQSSNVPVVLNLFVLGGPLKFKIGFYGPLKYSNASISIKDNGGYKWYYSLHLWLPSWAPKTFSTDPLVIHRPMVKNLCIIQLVDPSQA